MLRFVEREWTDRFGTHYEAAAQDGDGAAVHRRKVTKDPLLGWPSERSEAAEDVRRAALSNRPVDNPVDPHC